MKIRQPIPGCGFYYRKVFLFQNLSAYLESRAFAHFDNYENNLFSIQNETTPFVAMCNLEL